ncbi:MAG: DUF3990 domain-containing protein [Bacteroidales bacterium]|jgi:hypothetical protein|nr:DUF3990 domain-containing protein [Bacteroidales bacterium]
MRLYHGSYTVVKEIDLSKGERYRDFGRGFYTTKFRSQAESWAKRVGTKYGNSGFVSEFEFTETFFDPSRKYNVLRFDGYTDQWLDFVVLNRDDNFIEQRHDYDLIEGPVADDKIQYRLRQFLNGRISREQFLKELSYHEETHQICFCTLKSLQTMGYVSNNTLFDIEDIGEKIIEKLMLDKKMNEVLATELFFTSAIFAELENEAAQLHKCSWQEIYEMLNLELKQ